MYLSTPYTLSVHSSDNTYISCYSHWCLVIVCNYLKTNPVLLHPADLVTLMHVFHSNQFQVTAVSYVLPKSIFVGRALMLYSNTVLYTKVITFHKVPLSSVEVRLLFRNYSCTSLFHVLPSVLGSLHTLPTFKLRNCYYLFISLFLLDPNVLFQIFISIFVNLSGCKICTHIHKTTEKYFLPPFLQMFYSYSLYEDRIVKLV